MSQSLEDVKKIIKSLVLAQQNGLSPLSLNSEFIDVEGRPIPWKSFGSNTLSEFLRTLTDIIVPGLNKAGEQVFFPRIDSSTAHIAKFVAQQKPQPVKRRNNMVRYDDKRPCRELNSVYMLPGPSSPSPPPQPPPPHSPERSGSRRSGTNGTSDRRREPEKSERFERRRIPSPMSISPPPRHSPTPEPDRFRNPSPPRHGRSHSFRDPSPNRSRRLLHDVNLSNQPSTSNDYDKELARARERRGLNSQSSRSRRSRSPSPRRSNRHRPSPPPPSPPRSRRSPPRIQSKSVSCQTEPGRINAKKLVSVCCQTENQTTEKPVSAKAQSAQSAQSDASEPEDLNLAYYGPNYGVNYNNINNPYASNSGNPVYDPSYEEDKSQPGYYYDFDAGSLKQIPIIPEWYANWIVAGWATGGATQQQQQQNPFQYHQPYPTTPYQAPTTPTIPITAYVNSTPPEAPPQPMKVIPTTPSAKSATRDPRLARQTANLANNNANKTIVNNHDKQSTVANAATAKRKALSINDYMKTRKLGPDKSQHIINEEAQETPEKMNNSPDHHGKWGTKRV